MYKKHSKQNCLNTKNMHRLTCSFSICVLRQVTCQNVITSGTKVLFCCCCVAEKVSVCSEAERRENLPHDVQQLHAGGGTATLLIICSVTEKQVVRKLGKSIWAAQLTGRMRRFLLFTRRLIDRAIETLGEKSDQKNGIRQITMLCFRLHHCNKSS